jgi:hypothetical protein
MTATTAPPLRDVTALGATVIGLSCLIALGDVRRAVTSFSAVESSRSGTAPSGYLVHDLVVVPEAAGGRRLARHREQPAWRAPRPPVANRYLPRPTTSWWWTLWLLYLGLGYLVTANPARLAPDEGGIVPAPEIVLAVVSVAALLSWIRVVRTVSRVQRALVIGPVTPVLALP